MIKISRRLQKAGKKAIVVLAVLMSILALMAGILVYKVTEQKKYNNQLSLGEKYLAELDYENAKLCFLSAIEINDRYLKPYVALCNTYIGLGNYEKAYEVVYQIEEVVSKYYKGENQDIVDELTESIDKYESAAGAEYKEEIDDDESSVKDEKQPEKINPTKDYMEILEEYKKVAESNFSEELLEQSSYINDGVWNFRGQDIYSVYYRLADLSDDQSPELLISVNEKETPHSIVDVYGMQDGVAVRIIESNPSVGYRSIYYITEDKRIKNVGSGGALYTQIIYYKVPSGSVTMELDEQYIYNGEQGDVYTHIGSDDVSTVITKENYMQVLNGEDVDYESEWQELYAGKAIHYIE